MKRTFKGYGTLEEISAREIQTAKRNWKKVGWQYDENGNDCDIFKQEGTSNYRFFFGCYQ